VQIEDRAGSFDRVSDCFRACGKTAVNEFFIFEDETLKLSFLCSDGVEGFDVKFSKTFDVYRSTVLDDTMMSIRQLFDNEQNLPCPSCGSTGDNICRLLPSP